MWKRPWREKKWGKKGVRLWVIGEFMSHFHHRINDAAVFLFLLFWCSCKSWKCSHKISNVSSFFFLIWRLERSCCYFNAHVTHNSWIIDDFKCVNPKRWVINIWINMEHCLSNCRPQKRIGPDLHRDLITDTTFWIFELRKRYVMKTVTL